MNFSPNMDVNPIAYAPDGTAIMATDAQLMVRFYKHPMQSLAKSKSSGTPIYEDVIMIEVIQPGEKDPVKQLANEWHKRRFPRDYKAFCDGQEAQTSGTLLDHLFPAEPANIKMLNAINVYTVQQLAALSDSAINQIQFGRQLVDKAKAYLSSAHNGQNFHAMQAAMQKQIDELKALLGDKADALPEPVALNLPDEQLPPAKRKGRPTNAELAARAAAAQTQENE